METKSNINRSELYEDIYQELGASENKIFNSMRDVMLFCASLAMNKELTISNEEIKSKNSIKVETFNGFMNIIDIIAISHTKDITILIKENETEKYTIFEKYANSGIEYINKNVIGENYRELMYRLIEENREVNLNNNIIKDLRI